MSCRPRISTATTPPSDTSWFGHPRGLATLFFTEMWERFSYYGMRALLMLFMTAVSAHENPGLDFDVATAGAVYGLYTSMVYLLALPGGWIADRLWGQRKAVFVGGCIIALGHFTLAAPLIGAPNRLSFFLGLLFIVLGTGLLKPNVSTMVGDLYSAPNKAASQHEREEWGARREAAFSIFYMGINIGAVLGPFICSTLAENVNWHLGFAAAGFGMILGLIQYRAGGKYLGQAGLFQTGDPPEVVSRRSQRFWLLAAVVAAIVALVVWLLVTDTLGISLRGFATWVGCGILLLTILFFAYLIFGKGMAAALLALFALLTALLAPAMGVEGAQWAILTTLGAFILADLVLLAIKRDGVSVEKRRLMVICWLFLLSAIFWSGFEQAGSSLNLFAQNFTDRNVFGWEMPAGWLQNVNPVFIISLAPVFGAMWTWLAQRNRNPSIPMKFALGLLALSAGFVVIMWGATNASAESPVSMGWLIATYFLFTCGELALSPVGLSSMTKLAPRARLGQMMGVWFIGGALGNLIAGLLAGRLAMLEAYQLYCNVAVFVGIAGIVALLLSPFVKRLTGGYR
ncbi:MAG: peptide MFS transporter [Nitrococcus sp.]|nr:peptide MFS transporter [Nitrococcus sp.]